MPSSVGVAGPAGASGSGVVPGSPVPSVGSPPLPAAGVSSGSVVVPSPAGVSGLTTGGSGSAGVPGRRRVRRSRSGYRSPRTCSRPSRRPNRVGSSAGSVANRRAGCRSLPRRRWPGRRGLRAPGRPAGRRLLHRRPLRDRRLPRSRSLSRRAVGARVGAAGVGRSTHRRFRELSEAVSRRPCCRRGSRRIPSPRCRTRSRTVGGGLGAGVGAVGLVVGRARSRESESVESDSPESECELSESDSEELESELSESDSPESEELSEALTEAGTAAAARVGAARAITTSTSPHSAAARTAIRRASGSSRARRVVSMPVTSRGAFQQAGDSIANCLAVSITRGIEMIPMSTDQRRAVAPGRELGDRAAQAHLAAAATQRTARDGVVDDLVVVTATPSSALTTLSDSVVRSFPAGGFAGSRAEGRRRQAASRPRASRGPHGSASARSRGRPRTPRRSPALAGPEQGG